MTSHPSNSLLTLLVDDRGARLLTPEGELLGRLPDFSPGVQRRTAWAAALRELADPGTEIQILTAYAALTVQCQDAPYLSPKERQDVVHRLAAAEQGGGNLASAATLDTDPSAEGGHVLWMAMMPRQDMDDWVGALQGAGLSLIHATPIQRVILRGLEHHGEQTPNRILLVLDPGREGHLCIFQGRSLAVMRSFHLPDSEEEQDELVYQEVSRLLQFFKQKNRGVTFDALQVAGISSVSGPLFKRIQTTLKLAPNLLSASMWEMLQEGQRLERNRKDGLNLVPLEIQEALQRKVFKGTIWIAAVLMILLLMGSSALLYLQEAKFRAEAERAEATLAVREARSSDEAKIVQARLPLLRTKLAEARQAEAAKALSRLGQLLLEAPAGIQLEKVEITQVPGESVGFRFQVKGLALTDRVFSTGPLSQYVDAVAKEPGVHLAPLTRVSVSDRIDESKTKIDQRAITRFTLEGTTP